MAGPNFVLDKSWETSAAISKFHFVKLTGTEEVVMASSVGERALGVAQLPVTADDAARGKIASVRLLGISRVIAGGAIAQGDLVTTTAAGKAATAATGNVVLGIALNAAAADGDQFDVLLTPGGAEVPA